MDTEQALRIVLSLAQQNVLDDKFIDCDEDRDEQAVQNEACEVVEKLLSNKPSFFNFCDQIAQKLGNDREVYANIVHIREWWAKGLKLQEALEQLR